MGEHLADRLIAAAEFLRYLARYDESNALILLSRWLRVHDLDDLDKLEAHVQKAEADRYAPVDASCPRREEG